MRGCLLSADGTYIVPKQGGERKIFICTPTTSSYADPTLYPGLDSLVFLGSTNTGAKPMPAYSFCSWRRKRKSWSNLITRTMSYSATPDIVPNTARTYIITLNVCWILDSVCFSQLPAIAILNLFFVPSNTEKLSEYIMDNGNKVSHHQKMEL